MNVLINPNKIDIQSIFFMDTKTNIIMDGNFTKMVYSNAIFSTTAVFLSFPLRYSNILMLPNKYMLTFEIESNKEIIQRFIQIERDIIENYKQFYNIEKTSSYNLKNQLLKGIIKFYKESREHPIKSPNYYMKISGIWETSFELGITYKIIEYQ